MLLHVSKLTYGSHVQEYKLHLQDPESIRHDNIDTIYVYESQKFITTNFLFLDPQLRYINF